MMYRFNTFKLNYLKIIHVNSSAFKHSKQKSTQENYVLLSEVAEITSKWGHISLKCLKTGKIQRGYPLLFQGGRPDRF